jgi:type II secretory pathway pseudopilin PulG
MSEERRKRRQERLGEDQPQSLPKPSLKVVVIVGILALVALAIFIGWYRQNTRLDAFAKCLSAKQAKMYGAFWCPHCSEQKELFGASFKYAPYIECGITGQKGIQQVCKDANIGHFPTWIFANGARFEGKKSLEFLSDQTGCSLP